MKIQLIRNATIKVTIDGTTFLVDPWLAARGSGLSFAQTPQFTIGTDVDPVMNDEQMPICDLPMSVAEVLDGVDAYMLTHLHPDHFDMDIATGELGRPLRKDVPIFVQNDEEASLMKKNGFADVRVFADDGDSFDGVCIRKTPAKHGTIKPCGPSVGLVLESSCGKKLYIAGDTVWYDEVAKTLEREKPDVVVLNSCCASLADYGHLIMDDAAIANVHAALPSAKIIAVHMDNVAHATLTRKTLSEKLNERGIGAEILIPADGETIEL